MTNKLGPVALFAAICLSAPAAAQSGIALYEDNCAACHGGYEMGDDRVAPPIFAVQGHYLSAYPDKTTFTKAIVAWAKDPSQARARMPGAIRRFGLMPAVELSDEDAAKIAEFIYDGQFDRPGWYADHYRQEHGKAPK